MDAAGWLEPIGRLAEIGRIVSTIVGRPPKELAASPGVPSSTPGDGEWA